MRVRLKDIATDLGVSIVTVSKVVRNHHDISEATKQRVLQRMKELNYQPNLTARALVTGKSFIAGLVVPDLVHPFFAEVAKGLTRVLRPSGYGLVIASSEEDPELERQEIQQLLARGVDALIVATTQPGSDFLDELPRGKTQYILIDRQADNARVNFVGTNDVLVGRLATEHLLAQGCRRIAHLRGPALSTGLGRLSGYRAVLAEHKVSLPSEYIVVGRSGDDTGDKSGFQSMKKLMRLDPPPDAVFCYNDTTALGAMKAILEAGLSIPDDVAVVGVGNFPYSEMLRVPLTSVDQGSLTMGERIGKMALHLIDAKTPPQPKSILVKPKLIVRQSSKRSASG